jgi:hypothetical protein
MSVTTTSSNARVGGHNPHVTLPHLPAQTVMGCKGSPCSPHPFLSHPIHLFEHCECSSPPTAHSPLLVPSRALPICTSCILMFGSHFSLLVRYLASGCTFSTHLQSAPKTCPKRHCKLPTTHVVTHTCELSDQLCPHHLRSTMCPAHTTIMSMTGGA